MSEVQDGLVRRSEGLRVRRVDTAKRTALFVASDESLDSHEEVLEQDWRLDRFRKNPTILWAHDQEQLPIGRGLSAEVVDGELQINVEFAPAELNPFAEKVFGMVQADFIRACSVGFRPGKARREKRAGRDVWVLSENELYELSILPIGSNPNALGKGPDPLAGMKAAAIAAERAGAPAAEDIMADATKEAIELGELRVKFAASEKTIADLQTKLTKAETDKAAAETALAAATKTNAELSDKVLRIEVEALVGKKITGGEVDSQFAFAKLDRKAFDASMAARPDLKILGEVVRGGDADRSKTFGANGSDNGESLAEIIGDDED